MHEDAELAAARAAKKTGVPYIMSTACSRSIEEVAEANGDGHRWYQLYWYSLPSRHLREPTANNFYLKATHERDHLVVTQTRQSQWVHSPCSHSRHILHRLASTRHQNSLPPIYPWLRYSSWHIRSRLHEAVWSSARPEPTPQMAV